MTKYVPQHLVARSGRAESTRASVSALRSGRGAVTVTTAATLPLGAAAFMAAPALAAPENAPIAPSEKPVLSFNSTGESVVEVQSLIALVRDGYYGPVTTSAVKHFQQANNLTVDGVVGPKTWQALENASTEAHARPGSPDAILQLNDEGTDVRALQRALNVEADGIFGAKTEAAVRAFQTDHDLEVDGIVGPKTGTALVLAGSQAKQDEAAKKQAAAEVAKDKQVEKDAKSSAKETATSRAAERKSSDSKPAAAKKPVAVTKATTTSTKPATPAVVHPNAMYELPFLAGQSWLISQGPYGAASHHKVNDKHAVDFATPVGTPIVSSADGVVQRAVYDRTGGKTLLIRDASGYCMEYAHLNSFNVVPGQRVSQGQLIATSGATGEGITGPHLHWGIVDCSSYTSITIPDTKERGTSYIAGTLAVSRNGL